MKSVWLVDPDSNKLYFGIFNAYHLNDRNYLEL